MLLQYTVYFRTNEWQYMNTLWSVYAGLSQFNVEYVVWILKFDNEKFPKTIFIYLYANHNMSLYRTLDIQVVKYYLQYFIWWQVQSYGECNSDKWWELKRANRENMFRWQLLLFSIALYRIDDDRMMYAMLIACTHTPVSRNVSRRSTMSFQTYATNAHCTHLV